MKKKIIWAVNAMSTEVDWLANTAKTLEFVSKGLDATVEPVAVFPEPPRKGSTLPLLENLENRLEAFEMTNLIRPRLLPITETRNPSARLQVNTLTDYAVESGSDLIATQLYENKTHSPGFMGSFTENLCLTSQLPILSLHPQRSQQDGPKRILFATDFSPSSWEAFSQILGFSHKIGAQLTVLHWIEHPSVYHYGFFGMYMAIADDVIKQNTELGEFQMETFKKNADDLSIPIETLVKVGKSKTYLGIVQEAQDLNADIVAMASHTKKWSTPFLGSTTRQVLRHAPCSVWTIHP